MRWRRGRVLGVLALAVMTAACTNHKKESGQEVVDRMEARSRLSKGLGQAVEDGFAKERARTKAVANGVLQSGEPIWVQAGKSRMLHLPDSVRRVSIGNPEMAGVVVLGPRTIMINAKPFERERQARSLK